MQHSDAQNSLDSVKSNSAEQPTNEQRSQLEVRGSRKKKKRRDSKLRLSAVSPLSQQLNSLRETLLTQGHLSKLPAVLAGERMPDGFFDEFQPEILSREPDDSIQHALAYVLRKTSGGKIDQAYKEARKSSLVVLFDCSVKANFEKSCLESDSFAEAYFRSLILLDPRNITENPPVAKYLADEMEKNRTRFLKSLSKDCYNADRRRQRVPVDVCSYILARYWTNKHCPLWLMRRDAQLKACKSLAPGEFWTDAVVKERIKKHRLRGCRRAPITMVLLGKDKQIAAFEIEGAIFNQLCLKKFGYDFLPPKSQVDTKYQSGSLPHALDLQKTCSASNLAMRKEDVHAGAPKGFKELRDLVHAVQRRADIIVDRISRLEWPLDDLRCEREWAEVAALNKVAAVIGTLTEKLKFRHGWVEPHLVPRYRAIEAKKTRDGMNRH